MAIKHSTVHLLHPDSTETAENVATFFAHDVPLMMLGGVRVLGCL